MKYFPIFQELFESDSVIFMLIGLILAVYIGAQMKSARKTVIGFGLNFVLYIICEFASNIHTNFLIEIILIIVGTAAIGGTIGFQISAILAKLEKQ